MKTRLAYDFYCEPATPEHCALVAAQLRPADADEFIALKKACGFDGSIDVLAFMLDGLQRGSVYYWSTAAGEPVGIFGCAFEADAGVPWFLATARVAQHPVSSVKIGRRFVAAWLCRVPALCNIVSARHTAAQRYIKALGFTLEPCTGTDGFMLFSKEKAICVHP